MSCFFHLPLLLYVKMYRNIKLTSGICNPLWWIVIHMEFHGEKRQFSGNSATPSFAVCLQMQIVWMAMFVKLHTAHLANESVHPQSKMACQHKHQTLVNYIFCDSYCFVRYWHLLNVSETTRLGINKLYSDSTLYDTKLNLNPAYWFPVCFHFPKTLCYQSVIRL